MLRNIVIKLQKLLLNKKLCTDKTSDYSTEMILETGEERV